MTSIPHHNATHGCQLLLRRGPGHSQHEELITLPAQGTNGSPAQQAEITGEVLQQANKVEECHMHGCGIQFMRCFIFPSLMSVLF